MKTAILSILVLALCVGVLSDPSPPLYDFSYYSSFDDTFVVNGTNYEVNGQQFYDPKNNRERVDRTNGRYDGFCSGVIPNVSTPCIHYTVNNKRWLAFPQKKVCCFCCDSAHGCGILRSDWLRDAKYEGEEKIIDTVYEKWSQDGMFGYNYFWASKSESRAPRKLDQGGKHITDYSTHSFRKQTFEDSVFALPVYCNQETIVNCPLESICGKLRNREVKAAKQ